MKAEQRKALEQNDLAAGLEKTVEAARQGPPRGLVTGLVIATILVSLFLVWYWLSTSAAQNSANLLVALEKMRDGADVQMLADYAKSVPPEGIIQPDTQTALREQFMVKQLETFSKENPRGVEGRLGRLRLARLALYLGERDLANDGPSFKQTARTHLELARNTYKSLVSECADFPLLQQEAILNQARASESLGEIEEAVRLYKQLVDSNKESKNPSVELAAQQLKRLETKTGDALAKEVVQKTIGTK